MMNRLRQALYRFKRGRAGNVMLEFAIGSGVLVAAFTGTFQFGYTFYAYNKLATAVYDGAHYAALRPYDSTTTTPSDAFKTAVTNMVVYGNPAGGTTPIVPGLTTDQVKLTTTFSHSVPSTVTVAINGYTIDSLFAQNTLTNKPQVTYPYLGIYSPF
jgi:Flp pilus assembly protein TadG